MSVCMQPAAHAIASKTARASPARGQVAAGLVIGGESGFDYAGGEYAGLFATSTATVFQHPLWLAGICRHLAPHRGAEAHALTGRDAATGQLRFVLPLIQRRVKGAVLLESADLGVSDYAAPVIDAEWRTQPKDEAAVRRAVAAALPAHDMLRLRPIRAEALADWRLLLGGAAERQAFSAHAVALAPPYQAWRDAALNGGFTKYLDRRKKRFFKLPGARLRLLEQPTAIEAAIDAIRHLRQGRFEGDMIQHEPVRDFYAEMAVQGAAQGFARTYTLEAEGEALGHVFGLFWRGRYHYLLIGCDYERHGRHSPGLILYDTIIEDLIAAGGACFDFTIGDEPFKMDFGTSPTAIYALTAQPTLRGRLMRAGLEARQRLTALRRSAGKGKGK